MNNEENTVEYEERIVSIIETINFGFGNRKINSTDSGIIILTDKKITVYTHPNNMSHILIQDAINSISLLTNALVEENMFLQRASFKSIVYDLLRDAVKNDYSVKKVIECFILTLREFLMDYSSIYLFDGQEFSVNFI